MNNVGTHVKANETTRLEQGGTVSAAGLVARGVLFGLLLAPGVLGVTAAVIALPSLAGGRRS